MAKELPRDIEAEQALLSSCLQRPEIAAQVQGVLNPADFYLDAHAHIFEAVCALGKEADVVTVADRLKAQGHTGERYTVAYLDNLRDLMSTSAGWKYHAEIVKEKSQRRQLITLCGVAAEKAYQDHEPLEGTLSELKSSLIQSNGKQEIPSNSALVHRVYDDIERRHKDRKAGIKPQIGPLFGMDNIDSRMCGLRPGTVTVLAAESGMGKSAFALNAAENISPQGKILYFTLESTDELLMYRRLSRKSEIALTRLNTGNIFPHEWDTLLDCMGRISDDKNLMLIENSDFSDFSRMRSFCESVAMRDPLVLIVIDYLQLMYHSGQRWTSRHMEISTISRSVSQMAKALNVPVILISQLGKDVEKRTNRKPMLSDLKESGDIRNDAHNVVFLWQEREGSIVNVFEAKGKDMGKWETVVEFDKFKMTFKNCDLG